MSFGINYKLCFPNGIAVINLMLYDKLCWLSCVFLWIVNEINNNFFLFCENENMVPNGIDFEDYSIRCKQILVFSQ